MKHLLIPMVLFFALWGLSCKQGVVQKKETQEKMMNPAQTKVDNLSKEKTQPFHQEMVKNCNQTFDVFLEIFGRDSIFQKDRVKYPLEWSFIEDLETGKVGNMNINDIRQYNYIDFTKDKDAMSRESGKYKIFIEKKKGEVNYLLKGYDNGIYLTYKFELIDGCWYLVSILDESS